VEEQPVSVPADLDVLVRLDVASLGLGLEVRPRAPARSLSLWADSCSCWSWGRAGRVCWMAVAGGGGDV